MNSATEPIDSDPAALKAAFNTPLVTTPSDRTITPSSSLASVAPVAPVSSAPSAIKPVTPSKETSKREIYFINDSYLRNPYLRDQYLYDPYYLRPSSSSYNYQNINNDLNLQENVTDYFLEKTIGWIKNDYSFSKCKKHLKKLEGVHGDDIMYKLLKLFVKKGNTNWYDLKTQKDLVKDFIRHKLKSL